MGILGYITQGCDQLSQTVAPSIAALGLHMVLALATIMMVWFGVQEALSAAHHGHGFSMAKFFSFFMLITFAYTMVKYYDTAIPGLGFSLTGFIRGGADNIVTQIGVDTTTQTVDTLNQALSRSGPGIVTAFTAPYIAMVYVLIQFLLALLSALIAAIIAYGAVASTIIGLLGPIFIPFLVFDKLDFLFWGWLRAYLSFTFYKVVAAATLSVLSHLFTAYYVNFVNFTDPASMIKNLPLLILLVFVNLFILIKIPAMTASIFSGSSSGHDAGMGMVTSAITAGVLR